MFNIDTIAKLEPQNTNPKNLVIFLHGYGADGYDLIQLAPYFKNILEDSAFISPNAPQKTPFGGYQWFGLSDLSPAEITIGVKQAQPALQDIISKSLNHYNLEYSDLILVGFSQGTMMALYTALQLPKPIKAVIGFSGALPDSQNLHSIVQSKPPICLVHGDEDMIVPVQSSIHAKEILKALNVPVDLHIVKNAPHSIPEEGLTFALNFLKKTA
jgi:phospholipase/carboxylesterase